MINIVVGLAFLAFVGVPMAPWISSLFSGGQPSPATSSPGPTAVASPAAKKEELAAQAKGYELVLQREPNNPTALKGLLETRLALGDTKGAIEPLEKLAKLNPNETLYSVLLAQAKQQMGDREGAAQTYRNVLSAKPGDMDALNGLAALLLQQNRPEAAVGLLQDTLKTSTQANQLQPGSIDVTSVQILLGGVYASQKRFDEAIAIYGEAAKTNKQDFRPVYGKAVVLKEQGKLDQAKPLFTKAAELAPAKYRDQINQMASNPPSSAPIASPAAPAKSGSPTTTTEPVPKK